MENIMAETPMEDENQNNKDNEVVYKLVCTFHHICTAFWCLQPLGFSAFSLEPVLRLRRRKVRLRIGLARRRSTWKTIFREKISPNPSLEHLAPSRPSPQ